LVYPVNQPVDKGNVARSTLEDDGRQRDRSP
jgi:hypothetical protein